MTSFGLHVGNTNCCLAVHKDYSANVVANDAGSRVTPAGVTFSEDGEILTGLSARQFLARFPKSGVRTGNKAAIGEIHLHTCIFSNSNLVQPSSWLIFRFICKIIFSVGVTGNAEAAEKLAQNFHVTSMGPKLISADAGLYYEVDKQKKVFQYISYTLQFQNISFTCSSLRSSSTRTS